MRENNHEPARGYAKTPPAMKAELDADGKYTEYDSTASHIPNYGVAQQFRNLGESNGR